MKKSSTIPSSTSPTTNPSTTNMKIVTKDNQMFMSIDVNGTVYQGILLAVDTNIKQEFTSNNTNDFITDQMNALSALFGNDLSSNE